MLIFDDLTQWIHFRNRLDPQSSLGLVATMGNLHLGHASLFSTSVQENHHTVCSVFINPTQFNRQDDFDQYPRTLEQDLKIMEQTGIDFCLIPKEKDIYEEGYTYQVHERQLSQLMEGVHRPGHFNGVLTVVLKLLNLTQAQRAYFGEKDYQQFLLIQAMVKAFFIKTQVVLCPTLREPSNLAYSSRNNRLNAEQRNRAEEFAQIFHQAKSCEQIKSELESKNIAVDYIEEHQGRRFAAVFIDDIRLIDNYPFDYTCSTVPATKSSLVCTGSAA